MAFSLDHIVIAVSDLDRAASDYSKLGFTFRAGGRHPGRGSMNALIVFEDGTYFELISFPEPVPGFSWWQVLTESGSGYVDFAVVPDDPVTGVDMARKRGFVAGEPEMGGRTTPGGQRIEWQTIRPPASNVPFICADITPRRLRVPEGAVRKHPNGVKGIASVSVAVSNLPDSARQYEALLGANAALRAPGDCARFFCSPAIIELHQTGPDAALLTRGSRGEGVVSVSLFGSRRTGVLDANLTHGARISIEPNPE